MKDAFKHIERYIYLSGIFYFGVLSLKKEIVMDDRNGLS